MRPMNKAPKDKLILLFIPEFGCSAETWWPGNWSWAHDKWSIRTPFTHGNKLVTVIDMPEPMGWVELPNEREFKS